MLSKDIFEMLYFPFCIIHQHTHDEISTTYINVINTVTVVTIKQNITEQNKTKLNKTEQTKQNITEHNKTKQNKTKQNKTKQNKTKQRKTENRNCYHHETNIDNNHN